MSSLHRRLALPLLVLITPVALALGAYRMAPPAAEQPVPMSSQGAGAQPKAEPALYVSVEQVDFRAILPMPPGPGSDLQRAEIELVLAIQASASPESKARALAEVAMTPAIFADVLGEDFNPQKKPVTFAWLTRAAREAKQISDAAKDVYARVRPFGASPLVKAPSREASASYPSGHATRAMVWAELLAQIHPDRAEQLRERARLVGYDRVVLGVHYPSDVTAGYALAGRIVKAMDASPAFQKDREAARVER